MLKPDISRAYWDETDVGLTLTEFKIVHLLASNVGSYVTYRSLSMTACTMSASSRGAARMATERTSALASSGSETSSAPVDPEFSEIDNYQSFGYRWGKA